MTREAVDESVKRRALEYCARARKDLNAIQDKEALDWANQSVTIVLSRVVDFVGAKRFTDEMADLGARISALTIVAEIQASGGQTDEARKTLAQAIELAASPPAEKAGTWGIGRTQARMGDFAAALLTTKRMEAWAKASLLVDIAEAQWDARDRSAAMASYAAARGSKPE